MIDKSDLAGGRLIAVPVGDGLVLGQVYKPGVSFFLLLFGFVESVGLAGEKLLSQPVLGSWTNDAEVFKGRWQVLGEQPIAPSRFREPSYRVLVNGSEMIESFDGSARRPIRHPDDDHLTSRKTRSPLLVEDAVRAFYGLGQWQTYYEPMLIYPARPQTVGRQNPRSS